MGNLVRRAQGYLGVVANVLDVLDFLAKRVVLGHPGVVLEQGQHRLASAPGRGKKGCG